MRLRFSAFIFTGTIGPHTLDASKVEGRAQPRCERPICLRSTLWLGTVRNKFAVIT
jgi:hypothetical protein